MNGIYSLRSMKIIKIEPFFPAICDVHKETRKWSAENISGIIVKTDDYREISSFREKNYAELLT